MNFFVLSIISFLLLTSCGKNASTKEKDQFAEFFALPATFSNSPVFLEKQNKSCQSKSFQDFSKMFSLHLFLEGKKEVRVKDFSTLIQGLLLKDNVAIAQSYYDEKLEVLFVGEKTKVRLISPPLNIDLCPDDSEYLAETVESAALNTSFFINKTFSKFATNIPDIYVSPIVLNISPSIIQSYVARNDDNEKIRLSSYMTDNAFYMPHDSSITFLPHSQDARKNGMKTNYWEVPMVASHEYGHHLFQAIYKEDIKLQLNAAHNCFGPPKKFKNIAKDFKKRTVKIQDIINGYNEGFADLISFYTLDRKERDVQGVKCLETSRDVTSTRLYDWKSKKFDRAFFDSFFSNYEESSFSCEYQSYQVSHVFGAIFAHNADSFLSLMTKSSDEKLVALVNWVKYLEKQKKKLASASPGKFLEITMIEFLRMSASKFNRKFEPELCAKVRAFYPGLDMKDCKSE